MKLLKDICYAKREGKELLLDIYLPDRSEFPVFVFFHGGGLEGGNKSTAERFAGYLIDRGIAVVSASYRLYPDAKYPDLRDICMFIDSDIGQVEIMADMDYFDEFK